MAGPVAADVKQIEALVARVTDLREKLETVVRDLAKSTEELRAQVRKSPSSDVTSSYLAFASAHMRLANAAATEMSRTAKAGIRIGRAKATQEEEAKREELRLAAQLRREAQRAEMKEKSLMSLPPVDTSFEELYGEVTDVE